MLSRISFVIVLFYYFQILRQSGALKPPASERCLKFLPSYLANLNNSCVPTEALPIPEEASPRGGFRSVGYNISEIRPGGLWAVLSGGYISMIALQDRHLVLIDSPSPTNSVQRSNFTVMAAAAMEVLNGTVPTRVDLILSHSHTDHAGSATLTLSLLKRRLPPFKTDVWSSVGTRGSLVSLNTGRVPIPNRVFRRYAKLRIGTGHNSVPILLKVIGGHTEDDILVYFRPTRNHNGVMYSVDHVIPGWGPAFYFSATQNLQQYLNIHDVLMQFDFDTYVGGHQSRTGTKRDIEINKMYTLSVIEAARKAVREAPFFVEIAPKLGTFNPNSRNFGNAFFAVRHLWNMIEKACERQVVEKWGCRLGGVDAIALSNCVTARYFVQIDL